MARAVADDERIAAFAGVAGYYSDAGAFARSSPEAYQAAIDHGRAAETRWRQTGIADTIPAVAPDGGDVGMPLREAYEFYGTPRGAVANYTNGFAVQSLAHTTSFDAQEAAGRIRVPFLLVHSEHALSPPLARRVLRLCPQSEERAVDGVRRSNRLLRRSSPDRTGRRRNRRALQVGCRLIAAAHDRLVHLDDGEADGS